MKSAHSQKRENSLLLHCKNRVVSAKGVNMMFLTYWADRDIVLSSFSNK